MSQRPTPKKSDVHLNPDLIYKADFIIIDKEDF